MRNQSFKIKQSLWKEKVNALYQDTLPDHSWIKLYCAHSGELVGMADKIISEVYYAMGLSVEQQKSLSSSSETFSLKNVSTRKFGTSD